jgi:hypothetical protein
MPTGRLSRLPLVGGPLDGHDIRNQPRPFVWVGVRAGRGTIFAGPGVGRALYRRIILDYRQGETIFQRPAYIYAGDTHWVCPGCNGYMQRAERGGATVACSLCGAVPSTA